MHSQALIDNNLFHNNYTRSAVNNNFQSSSNGGAVFLYNPNWWNGSVNKPLSIFFRNNTIVNNSVRTDKAGSNIQAAGLMVQGWQVGYIYSYNNLIWGNDIVGEDNNQQIRVEIDEQRLIYTSDYNNIQNFEI